MLPTFVIGLREGLEAALIIGIIAAFLRKRGRSDLLRQMAIGVAIAIAICTAAGVGLELFSRDLPQRQQEALETVIGALAVGMVTYMVLWMKQNSRGLKTQLESLAADAMQSTGSKAGTAMVAMAFLAVLREGLETVVFLLAAFNESGSGGSALIGALLGIAVAIALGYGIYRGGVRINLSKFFRATGLVLVLVAGGLVVSALHTAHEAGWLDLGQHRMLDLSWLVQPGSVLSSLLTGMLGVQPYPVLAEVVGWLLYVVPLGVFVAWPPGRAVPRRALRWCLAGVAVIGLAAAAILTTTAPGVTPGSAVTRAGAVSVRVVGAHLGTLTVRTQSQFPIDHRVGEQAMYTLNRVAARTLGGLSTETYVGTVTSAGSGPATISTTELARLNGGRLPIGVVPHDGQVPVRYVDQRTLTVEVQPQRSQVLGLRWQQERQVLATGVSGQVATLATPTATGSYQLPTAAARLAADQAGRALDRRATHDHRISLAWLAGLIGAAAALGLIGAAWPRPRSTRVLDPDRTLIRH